MVVGTAKREEDAVVLTVLGSASGRRRGGCTGCTGTPGTPDWPGSLWPRADLPPDAA